MNYDQVPIAIMILTFKGVSLNTVAIQEMPLASKQALEEMTLVDLNTYALSLFKAESKAALQSSLGKCLPPTFGSEFMDSVRNQGPEAGHRFEQTCLDLEGRALTLQFAYTLSDDEAGHLTALFTMEDMGSGGQAKAQDLNLALLPKANPNIVILINGQGQVEYINPKGLEFIEVYQSSQQNSILSQWLEGTSEILDDLNTLLKRGDNTFKVLDRTFKVDLSNLKEANKTMVVFTDITDLVHLSDEREVFYEGLEMSTQPVIITDEQAQIIYVNQSLVELYGYSKEELQGKNPKIFNPGRFLYAENGFNEKHYEKLFSGLWKTLKNPDLNSWEGHVINIKKSRDLLHVRLNITKIRSSMGNKCYYLAFPIDVTDSFKAYETVKYNDLLTIAAMAELRDNETGVHMYRVGAYAKLISQFLGQTKKFADEIEISAPLHDVGKVGIQDSILLAERKLTFEEFEIMKTHTTQGYEILCKRDHMKMAALISKYHHEWFDGSGYPEKLDKDRIPLEARIVALCDVYDALRSKRPYKEPWTHEKAVESIVKESGTHFDPTVVAAFVSLSEDFETIFDTMQ